MPRPSPLSDKARLEEAIAQSDSMLEVLQSLGLRAAGGNYRQLKLWAERHGLEVPVGDHTKKTSNARAAKLRPEQEVFCENSTYHSRSALKIRLRKIWAVWVCAKCGLGEEWNGKPIVLQLEHVNGVWNDNRIENLCLLCPNCHSQTDTFAGKKHKHTPIV